MGIADEARRNIEEGSKQERIIASERHLWTAQQIEDKEEEVEDAESFVASHKNVLDDESDAFFGRRMKYQTTKMVTAKL